MTIFTNTFIPYEFANKREALAYVEERCMNIKKSLKFVEMDTEHLSVRCPVSGQILEIVGSEDELDWLHSELTKRKWYKM